MSPAFLYAGAGAVIFCVGFHGLVVYPHILRKALALNFMSSGIFLVLVAMADRSPDLGPDPVPDAIVLTSIVVAVCTTGLLLALFGLYNRRTELTTLGIESEEDEEQP